IHSGGPIGETATGENWLHCGGIREADASTALTIGRDAGWTVVALNRGGYDTPWLLWSFRETTRRRMREIEQRATHHPLELHRYNIVKPNLVGAQQGALAEFRDGQVNSVPCYRREN